jgi:hypothetical protein
LEYVSAELCDRLRAPVEFRGDAQYQLGDTLPQAIARLGSLYAKGKKAANSWGQAAKVKEIGSTADSFSKLAAASGVDYWQINTAIHYNAWENFTKSDFLPVVAAFRALLAGFCCGTCGAYMRVSPDRGTVESLRCECGEAQINLQEK